eukprot:GHVS01099842.1.p1 GENE.GHVS01099842.1~~GHVS01099842.1.p1  ORF type:complete len:151 (+),score=20.24 GHVS01099842.1:42-494(+)
MHHCMPLAPPSRWTPLVLATVHNQDRQLTKMFFRRVGCLPSVHLRKDFSSHGYPQGNAINESFTVLLGEATMAHNAAPNASLGDSPFRRLPGMESRLPGLAWLPLPSEEGRQQLQAEGRVQRALRVAIEAQSALDIVVVVVVVVVVDAYF